MHVKILFEYHISHFMYLLQLASVTQYYIFKIIHNAKGRSRSFILTAFGIHFINKLQFFNSLAQTTTMNILVHVLSFPLRRVLPLTPEL